jgi:hypothetical protein
MYARQVQNTEAERQACEIRLRAERKAGQLLRAMEKAKRGPGKGTTQRSQRLTFEAATLSDLGISKQQASDWQRLGAIPAAEFEADLTDPLWRRPTTSGLLHRHDARNRVTPRSHVRCETKAQQRYKNLVGVGHGAIWRSRSGGPLPPASAW